MTRRAASKSKNSNEALAVHEEKVPEDYAFQAPWITENDYIQSTGVSDTALWYHLLDQALVAIFFDPCEFLDRLKGLQH